MFTGVIGYSGKIKAVKKTAKRLYCLEIQSALFSKVIPIGGSVSVNGVCLTVVSLKNNTAAFDILGETFQRTALGDLKTSSIVNLERPLKYGQAIEGHFVLGHVDGVGSVKRVIEKKKEKNFLIDIPKGLKPYFFEKASVTVDGVSLTVGRLEKDAFWVYCVAHTLSKTNIRFYSVGSRVNLEADILAKLARRFY